MQIRSRLGLSMLVATLVTFSTNVASQPRLLRQITVNEGLSQNTIYCMLQDSRGFIWIGTADGLNRYDGYSIIVYRHIPYDSTSLPSNTVRSLAEGSDGTLWVSTERGVVRLDRRRAAFTRVRPEYASALKVDHRGILWMGTAGHGLLSYDPLTGRSRQYAQRSSDASAISSDAVQALAETPDGTLWLATELGLDALRGGRDTVDHIPLGQATSLEAMKATSMTATPDGSVWIGTLGGGLLRIGPTAGAVERLHARRGDDHSLPSDTVFSVHSDPQGNVLVGTSRGAAFWSRGGGKAFQQIPLAHPWGARVCLDRSGLVWIGTDGFGMEIHTLQPPKFHLMRFSRDPARAGDGDFLKAVFEDRQGIVWVGSFGDGLTIWDRRLGRSRHIAGGTLGLRGNSVYAISGDSAARIWVGTEEGLHLYDSRTGRFRFFGSPGRRARGPSFVPQPFCVNAICAEPNGDLWVGTNSGFHIFDTQTLKYTSRLDDWTTPRQLTKTWTNTIYCDGDSIVWIGTQYAGLLKADRFSKIIRAYSFSPHDTTSLSSVMVKAIHRDSRGRLWIGTDIGLNLANESTATFTKFYERDGLPSSYLYGILEDGSGNLWISSNHGITRFSPETKSFRNYDRDDGLQSNEFNTGAYFKNSAGEMYFGGVNGLNYFHPDSVRDNPVVPRIVLTGFKKSDVPASYVPDPSDEEGIVLAYGESVFSLQFAGLEYTNILKNQYAYMLEGFEENWVLAGTRREVRYTSLAPGEYVFRVKGSNGDGIWSEEALAVRITIIPPFWRSWWFLALCGLGILGTVGGSIRYLEMRKLKKKITRLEQEEAVQRERVRISRDMHDELGASLTRISLLAGIGSAQGRSEEEIRNQLRKIEETSREVVQRLDEVVWMVNPKNDTLESLSAYIAEYAEQFFAEGPVRCRFDIPAVLPQASLPADTRRNVFLTIKEAFNNVLKHSGADMVTLQLTVDHDTFRFAVTDNGRGFQVSLRSGLGNGLSNMKKRIHEIGGDFSIESSIGQGTTIAVVVHLPSGGREQFPTFV